MIQIWEMEILACGCVKINIFFFRKKYFFFRGEVAQTKKLLNCINKILLNWELDFV